MIYLDHCATTAVLPEVLEAMLPFFREEYGNPSSKYYPQAERARKAVEWAREQVADLIHGKPEEIVFTCGATESNNTILKGVTDYRKYYEHRGNHIVTSQVEHHAVLNTCRFLNGDIYSNHDDTFTLDESVPKVDRGFTVTFLPVDPFGRVRPEELERALRPETTLISLIWGNNELGTLNDIRGLSQIARERDIFFHSDATQVLGKIPIDVNEISVDALSFSAHKLYGPKGVGALYIRTDEYGLRPPISSLMHGGSQENGLRGGTLSVPNIVGFGKAAELAKVMLEENLRKMKTVDAEVLELLRKHPNVELLGPETQRIPGVFSLVFREPLFHNERFLRRISDRLALSTGSACSAGEPSHVLQAIGRGDQTGQVLRVSLGPENSAEDVQVLLQMLEDGE